MRSGRHVGAEHLHLVGQCLQLIYLVDGCQRLGGKGYFTTDIEVLETLCIVVAHTSLVSRVLSLWHEYRFPRVVGGHVADSCRSLHDAVFIGCQLPRDAELLVDVLRSRVFVVHQSFAN